eukprot:m.411957 g.411957  ORF g.411957 m.411957 type:complete len:376 (-) comp56561_c0_seq6:1853-2980(-)
MKIIPEVWRDSNSNLGVGMNSFRDFFGECKLYSGLFIFRFFHEMSSVELRNDGLLLMPGENRESFVVKLELLDVLDAGVKEVVTSFRQVLQRRAVLLEMHVNFVVTVVELQRFKLVQKRQVLLRVLLSHLGNHDDKVEVIRAQRNVVELLHVNQNRQELEGAPSGFDVFGGIAWVCRPIAYLAGEGKSLLEGRGVLSNKGSQATPEELIIIPSSEPSIDQIAETIDFARTLACRGHRGCLRQSHRAIMRAGHILVGQFRQEKVDVLHTAKSPEKGIDILDQLLRIVIIDEIQVESVLAKHEEGLAVLLAVNEDAVGSQDQCTWIDAFQISARHLENQLDPVLDDGNNSSSSLNTPKSLIVGMNFLISELDVLGRH